MKITVLKYYTVLILNQVNICLTNKKFLIN